MADLSQLEAALINADKAGDTDAAKTLAAEIMRVRAAPKPVVESSPRPNSTLPLKSVAMGLRDPISGAAQLLERSVPEAVATNVNRLGNFLADRGLPIAKTPERGAMDYLIQGREQDYQAERAAAGKSGFDPLRMGGNIATSALLTRGVGAPASLGGRIAQGAGIGAASGATAPVTEGLDDFWSQKGVQTGAGLLAGGVIPVAASGIARVIKPKTSKEVIGLLDEGVTPTPGQILGGVFRTTEDKMTSLPIVGDAIRSARGKSLDEFNRAAYARALEPIGGKVPKEVGREGVRQVREQLNDAYEALLPKVSFKADPKFVGDLKELIGMASQLPKQQAEQFEKILGTQVHGKMTPAGLMSGERIKEVESELGRLAKGYAGDSSFDNRQLGTAITQLQNLIRQNLIRSNPEHADALSKINKGYAQYARIRDAAARQGSTEGKFTPAQLSAAVRSQDKTVGKRAFSEGDALMQDLSDAGKGTLQSTYPDSGSIGRLALGAGALGAGYYLSPEFMTGAGVAALPFLPGGRQATAALLARRPEFAGLLANQVRALSPVVAGSGGLLAAGEY